jgi:hypothetical protein
MIDGMSKNGAMTIMEFLEARIEDDEARSSNGWARLGDSRWETDNYGRDFLTPSAVLAECAAKRKILVECRISNLSDLDSGEDDQPAPMWGSARLSRCLQRPP